MKRIYLLILMGLTGCQGFLEIDAPKDQITPAAVFENDNSATAALTGIYARMAGSSAGFASGGIRSVTLLAGLSSDELISFNSSTTDFFDNTLTPSNGTVQAYLWKEPYQYIYTANSILENLSGSDGVSAGVKKQLRGEALMIRAFCYFYLVNLFGDVPLHLNTEYQENNSATRRSADQVYEQIISDLKEAAELLDENYVNNQRARPNKWAAKALLARVYLFQKDWENAVVTASEVIGQSQLYLLTDLSDVFHADSREAIWQLMPVIPGINTQEAGVFIVNGSPQQVALDSSLLTKFEKADQRKSSWIARSSSEAGSFYFPFKYKVSTSEQLVESSMVIRLAELYLIRAEANYKINQFSLAVADINKIRFRAGLKEIMTASGEQLRSEIENERRLELFTEWGHRWLDLKRWGRADAVLAPVKKQNWQPIDALYPIPLAELSANPKIVQNPGY